MDITVIPPHTTLVSKIERLKCIIEYFEASVTRDMKGLLKDELNARENGGPGFARNNLILSKLDEIITYNKFTAYQSTGEKEERVLHLVKYGVYSDGGILIFLEEERDNDYCGAIG